MLRNIVLAAALLLTAAGLALTLTVGLAGVQALIFGVVLSAGVLFERVRYKRLEAQAPGPGFEPTPERFRDEATGAVVTVHVNPATGERRYVRE